MPAPGVDSTAGRHRRHADVGRVLMLLVLLALPRGGPTLAAAPGGDAPSLAVVETDKELGPLADLLTAQLSQEGVQLVERKQLDVILQEQELSAAGLTDPKGLVKVGGLLRADAIVLLSLEQGPPGALLRVRVAETAAGVRLLDTYASWDPARPQQAAGELAGRLGGAVARLRLPQGRLVPVGIVDFHGVQLAEERQWVCRALKTMLSARLGREPSIAVLEREDLERLREEKLLTQGPPGGLWGSAVLIDGYVNGAAGKMVAEIRVRKNSTAEPVSISEPLEEGSIGEAVGRIVSRLAQELGKAPPAGAWDARAEAAAFLEEGSLLLSHGRSAMALPLLETACALEPGNADYPAVLFQAALAQWPAPWQDPEYLANLARRTLDGIAVAWPPQNRQQAQDLTQGLSALQYYLGLPVATASERTIELNRENLRVCSDLIPRLNVSGMSPERVKAAFELRAARSAESVLYQKRKLIHDGILPSTRDGNPRSLDERFAYASSSFPPIRRFDEPLTDEGRAYLSYVQELGEDPDPVVQFFARCELARFAGGLHRPGDPELDGEKAHRSVLASWREHLDDWKRLSVGNRQMLGTMVTSAISHLAGRRPEAWWEEVWQPVLLPAIERRDPEQVLCSWTMVLHAPTIGLRAARRSVDALNQVAAMLRAASPQAYDVQVRQIQDRMRQIRDNWGYYAHTTTDAQRASDARDAFPDAAKEWAVPGVPTEMLLGRRDWPQECQAATDTTVTVGATTYQDGVLLGCLQWGSPPTRFCFFGIDLRSRRFTVFRVESVPGAPDSWPRMRDLVVGRDASYIVAPGVGLLVLPGAAGAGDDVLPTPRILGKQEGLPSPFVTGIAAHGEQLWLAYCLGDGHSTWAKRAEAGIGTYDPGAGTWHPVHCSTLGEEHPLSSGRFWEAHGLVASGQHCLFTVSLPGGGPDPKQISGLWSLDDSGAGARRLCQGLFDHPIVQTADGLFLRDGSFLANIDARSQRVELLLSSAMAPKADAWPVKKQPFFPGAIVEAGKGPSSSPLGDRIRMGNAIIHRGRLWSLVDQRIAVLDEGASVLSGFYPNNILEGQPAELLVSTPEGLVAIGKGRIGILDIDPADARSGRN